MGIRRTATVACCALLAGMGAAAARALEVPTLPTPTVTLTASVPSLPAPTPTPPPVTTTVAVSVPTPVPLQTPTPTPTLSTTPSLPAPIASPSGGGTGGTVLGAATGSSGSTASSSPGAPSSSGAAPEGMRPGEKVVAVSAATTRHRPGVVTVRFELKISGRVIVFVRGPLPSCNPTARFAVRGRRGPNAIRFDGTVGKQRLAEGSYLIGIKPTSSSTVRWAAVHVGPRGAQPLPRRIVRPALDQCSSAAATRALLLARFDTETAGSSGGTAGAETTRVKPPKPVERVPAPEAAMLPFSGIERAVSDLPPVLGYLLLALLGASLFGLTVFVVRFIRSPST